MKIVKTKTSISQILLARSAQIRALTLIPWIADGVKLWLVSLLERQLDSPHLLKLAGLRHGL